MSYVVLLVLFITSLKHSPQICQTVDNLLKDPAAGALIKQLNPNFSAPKRPFLRMSYVNAIKWLNDNGIQHEEEDKDGNVVKDAEGNAKMVDHVLGDDIAEAAERRMTDILGVPMFLYGFPAALKSFYMKKLAREEGETGPVCTESCDLLMPGVGEIVGAYCISLLIDRRDSLNETYRRLHEDC